MNQLKIFKKNIYEQDSKRFHRFQVITEAGIVGTIVPKNAEAMPKKLILEYEGEDRHGSP